MSGPKTSSYTLTIEQRRILEEQRRIERQKAIAKKKINKYSKQLVQMGGLFSSDKTISDELLSRNINDGGFGEKMKEYQQLILPCKTMISETNMDNLSSLEKAVETVTLNIAKAESLIKEMNVIATKNESTLRSSLASDIDSGFETSFADIKIETEIDTIKQKVQLQLEELKRNIILPDSFLSDINDALNQINGISDESFLKNYVSLSIKPIVKKCNNFLSDYEQYHAEFEELYTEYVALCELRYFIAQEYTCSAESISILQSEIKRIKETVAYDDEQGYISDCIDEVMEEMGYSVLGSREVTKKNGKHFRNELYTYGEGTAVNITYSSDGKIAMELGGIDTSDRLPDSNESAALCVAMECFCNDFEEIEKRLAAKGVIVAERISLLPPSVEYAQIINTTDYKMQQHTERLQVRKRQHTTQKNKTMKVD